MITVSKLAWPATPGVFLVNYLDNFLLLTSCDVLLGAAISELTAAIEQLPGGHFEAKEVFRTHATRGFDYLGHFLRCDGNAVRIAPTESNFHDFCAECHRMDTKIGNFLFSHDLADIARGVSLAVDELYYVSGFLSTFSRCDPAELEFYKAQLHDVYATLYLAGQSDEVIVKAVQARHATARSEHQVY